MTLLSPSEAFWLLFALGILSTSVMVQFCGNAGVSERSPLIVSTGTSDILGLDMSFSKWPLHVRYATKALAFITAMTMGCCYCIWLSEGCIAFLPFISDLGLHGAMRVIFASGAVLIAVLVAFVFNRVAIARHALCSALRLPTAWKCLNVVGSAGLFSAMCGVGFIGFYPWSTDLREHFCCVYSIFYGGFFWCISSAALSRQISRKVKEVGSDDEQPSSPWLQGPLALISVCSWAAMLCCFGLAFYNTDQSSAHGRTVMWDAGPSAVTWLQLLQPRWSQLLQQTSGPGHLQNTLHLAATDFHTYCQGDIGQGSWHSIGWVNAAALMEWILIGSLLGTVVVCVTDLDVYASLHKRQELC